MKKQIKTTLPSKSYSVPTTVLGTNDDVSLAKYINEIQKDNDGNITSARKTTTSITLGLNYEDYADYLCGVELDENGKVVAYNYNAEEKDCLVFYIEIDYDDDLVHMFRSHTNEDTLAEFRNDIGTISIKEVWG